MKATVVKKGLNVHKERRQMMHKAAAVYFLSLIEECLTTPVPLMIMTGLGAHLMLFTVDSGLIVPIHAQTVLVRMEVPAQ